MVALCMGNATPDFRNIGAFFPMLRPGDRRKRAQLIELR